MVKSKGAARSVCRRLAWKLMTGVAIAVLVSGCTKTSKKDSPQKRLAAFDYSKRAQRPALKPNHPLHIAATKWARVHQKKPADPVAALNYARTLKALGSKDKAMEVLGRTYQLNPGNGQLASEYGRLALDVGRVQLAEQLLNRAQRAKGQTDWRVLSAMGTLNAKRGEHKKAQSYYLAALRKKPDATSVFNNLALSYALDGRVGDAENLLKRAVAKGHNTRKVRQNLALVLGLQSKFGEAQQIAKADLNGDKVDNNVNFMRDMVKTTKVASAKTVKSISKSKAPQKVQRVKTASGPVSAETGRVATQTMAKQVPVNKAPVKNTGLAAKGRSTQKASDKATAKANTKTKKTDTVLPWQKKPSVTPAIVQTARLSPSSANAPTNLLPQGNTGWSTAVTENVIPASAPAQLTARMKPDLFVVPEAN